MADIPIQSPVFTDAGLTPAFNSAAAGDEVVVESGERVVVVVANGSGGSINVTIPAVSDTANVPGVGSVDVPDRVVAVPAGATREIGPIPSAYVGPNGKAAVNYSATSSVTRRAYRVPVPA